MPNRQIFGWLFLCSSRLVWIFLLTSSVPTFCPPAERDLIYWVFVEECVSPPFVIWSGLPQTSGEQWTEPDVCIPVKWKPPVRTQTSFLQILLLFTSTSPHHSDFFERRMFSVKCCCFFVFVYFSFRLRCPVYRLWTVQSHIRMHQYWSWYYYQ